VVFKWKDAFLCLLRDYLQAFLPGIESELPGGWTRKTEDDHGPGSSKGYVIWNDRNGVLKLVQVDKLKEAWKKCKPRAAFISANNEPGLFQKVFLSLLTAPPTGPQYNIVGVLDSHSTSTNRLEAILINDYRLRIPHNYPTDNNTAPAPTTVQAEAQQTQTQTVEEKADDQKMDDAADAESLLKKTTAEPDVDMAQESRGQKTKRSGMKGLWSLKRPNSGKLLNNTTTEYRCLSDVDQLPLLPFVLKMRLEFCPFSALPIILSYSRTHTPWYGLIMGLCRMWQYVKVPILSTYGY